MGVTTFEMVDFDFGKGSRLATLENHVTLRASPFLEVSANVPTHILFSPNAKSGGFFKVEPNLLTTIPREAGAHLGRILNQLIQLCQILGNSDLVRRPPGSRRASRGSRPNPAGGGQFLLGCSGPLAAITSGGTRLKPRGPNTFGRRGGRLFANFGGGLRPIGFTGLEPRGNITDLISILGTAGNIVPAGAPS